MIAINTKNVLMNKIKKLIPIGLLIGLFFYWIIGLFLPQVSAFTMSNSFYTIILGNMNSIAGQATSTSNTITFTSGEFGQGLYTGNNYVLCAGFYGGIYCNKAVSALFTFTVTPTALDFGTIDPTSPVVRTNTLSVLSTASGYSVSAIEDHSLQTANASVIPDTTCDSGTCDPTTAAIWAYNLTYGFGYRCDDVAGTDCVTFLPNYYRPFANAALMENPQIVLQNTSTGSPTENQSQITYKVNVSGAQIPGVYTNTITYIASPNF